MKSMKTNIYIAFYKYKKPIKDFNSFFDRAFHFITCLVTHSKYSHCELAIKTTDNLYECYSSSSRDHGVRMKVMPLLEDRWDLIEVDATKESIVDYFYQHQDEKYDYSGMLHNLFPFLRNNKKKQYCSEFVANALHLPEYAGYTPASLYRYITKS